MPEKKPRFGPPLPRAFWVGVAVVVAIKAAIFAVDHRPNFFMGDSGAFLATALTKWFPPQRSWTYGYFIRYAALPFHSLGPLVVWQTVAGALTSIGLGWMLLRYFAVAPIIASVAMALCALDPLQLLLERMVLPETFALMAMVLTLGAALAYLRRPTIVPLVLGQIVYAAAFSLRMQFLLALGLITLLLPLLARFMRSTRLGWRSVLVHYAVLLAAMAVLHGGYRWAMGVKHQHHPAYSYGTSLIALGALAPAITPADAATPAVAQAIADDAAFPLNDRSLRNQQLWEPGALDDRLRAVTGDDYKADAVAGAILRGIALHHPDRLLACGWRNHAEYWNMRTAPHWLKVEREPGPFEPEFAAMLRERFSLDVSGPPPPSLTKHWHSVSRPWLLVLLTSPLLMLAALLAARPRQRPGALLILLVGGLLLAQNTMLSTQPSYRYLQPLSVLTILAGSLLVDGWWRSRVNRPINA